MQNMMLVTLLSLYLFINKVKKIEEFICPIFTDDGNNRFKCFVDVYGDFVFWGIPGKNDLEGATCNGDIANFFSSVFGHFSGLDNDSQFRVKSVNGEGFSINKKCNMHRI